MPFTFAHPAIVLPLKKFENKLDLSALIVGSMIPDFEYFIKFKIESNISHTFKGIFLLDIPLCLVVLFLFHYIIKAPLILNLPRPFNIWFENYVFHKKKINSIKSIIIIIICSFIGILSHIMWDAFTHINGYFVNNIPFLKFSIYVFNIHIPIYKILQHGSTLLGFLIIFYYMYIYRNKAKNIINLNKSSKITYWTFIFVITVLILVYIILFIDQKFYINNIGRYIVSAISSFMIGTIIISLIYKCYILKY